MAPGSGTRQVTFSGSDSQSIAMARSMVEKIVSERMSALGGGGGVGSGGGGGGGGTQADKLKAALDAGHSSLKVKIPDSDVGLIIGKGGSTIKSIQERTGASIQIPSQADSDDLTVRTCVITHPEKAGCDNAKELMEDVLLKRNSGAGGGATIALGAGGETDTILVPDKDIGMIIGRAGCNIKELQRQSTSRIQIPPQADPGTQHRTCTITGSRAGCDMVKALISRILQERSTDFLTGGTAYTGQQQYGQQQAYGQLYQQGYGHQQGQQQQQQQQQQQGGQKDYSKEWAAYYAAQAQQQQQPQQVQQQPQQQQQPDPTDPTAYYDQFWKYAGYYGEEAARKYYGAWSPPVGTKNPNDSSSNNAPLAPPTAEQTNNQQSKYDSSNQTKIAAEDSSKRGVSNLPAWMTAGK